MTDLDTILADWHKWASAGNHESSVKPQPMWKQSTTPRGWDTTAEIIDTVLENDLMEVVDFEVSELCDVYRTALQLYARNLVTGWSVWRSPRLPKDKKEREVILIAAKNSITIRLRNAGVM